MNLVELTSHDVGAAICEIAQETFSQYDQYDWAVRVYFASAGKESSLKYKWEPARQSGRSSDLATALLRCRLAVRQGCGYTSEASAKAIEKLKPKRPLVLAPLKDSVAICVTVTKDCVVQYYVYVAMHGVDDLQFGTSLAQMVVPRIDRYVHGFGPGWNIGGCLPEGYQRIVEDVWP